MTAIKQRIAQLKADRTDNLLAAELIESLATQAILREAAEQYHRERNETRVALVKLIGDVNEMVAHLRGAVTPC